MGKKAKKQILIAGLPDYYSNYEKALVYAGFHPVYPPARPLSHLCTLNFDLLLLPGGGDISSLLYDSSTPGTVPDDYITDLLQFQLLQSAILKHRPVLGICKGMQLLNVYFGGSLHPHLPTADMHSRPDGDSMHRLIFSSYFPGTCRIFGNSNASFRLENYLSDYPSVNSAHHQGIRTLGQNLVILQYSEDYLPETIAHKTLPILGLQWHPERLDVFKENTFGKLLHLLLQSACL